MIKLLFTHVQYTQTDTIRQTDGPMVPMVRLVLIQKDVIPNGPIGEKKGRNTNMS